MEDTGFILRRGRFQTGPYNLVWLFGEYRAF